ncbi:MAG: hypothetical protein PF961_20130 [Planctomycetota bacterium]|jgi:hypothetical protein|nr:hypothetical protein [Planctomycetota bacterium]
MSDSDPIFRALHQGDEACPDGRALAAIGRLAREAAQPPKAVDLRASVLAACAELGDAADDDLIDEIYDGDGAAAAAADPGLAKLGEIVREAASLEREPDLLPKLEGKIQRMSTRRMAVAGVDHARSWRIWTIVVASHVAALFALAVLNVRFSQAQQDNGRPLLYQFDGARLSQRMVEIDLALPATWAESSPDMLLALRSNAKLRNQARASYVMRDAAGTVGSALTWLQARQDTKSGAIGMLSGLAAHDLAVQSLAGLALLGEGLDDPSRRNAANLVCTWVLTHVADQEVLDRTVGGLAALTLTEGALLLERDDLRAGAESLLLQLSASPGHERSVGLLVAAELAAVAGWSVPEPLRASMRAEANDANAVYAKQIGHGAAAAMGAVTQFLSDRPEPDAEGRLDLMAWWLPSLAVREVGGILWFQWSEELQRNLLPRFSSTPNGEAWLPGQMVRHAGVAGPAADVFATSLAVLILQTPYRYLPLQH